MSHEPDKPVSFRQVWAKNSVRFVEVFTFGKCVGRAHKTDDGRYRVDSRLSDWLAPAVATVGTQTPSEYRFTSKGLRRWCKRRAGKQRHVPMLRRRIMQFEKWAEA